MTAKAWGGSDIRKLARQTVDGKKTTNTARGAYFRALVETAQVELAARHGQDVQRMTVKAVHRRFYAIVQETIATDAVIMEDGFSKKEVALERNRRLNFARSAHGTIQRWLRASGHDLMKLDVTKVTKSQLEREAPIAKPQKLSDERVQARTGKLVSGLVTYAQKIAKVDRGKAEAIVREAMTQLSTVLSGGIGKLAEPRKRHTRTLFEREETSQRRAA